MGLDPCSVKIELLISRHYPAYVLPLDLRSEYNAFFSEVTKVDLAPFGNKLFICTWLYSYQNTITWSLKTKSTRCVDGNKYRKIENSKQKYISNQSSLFISLLLFIEVNRGRNQVPNQNIRRYQVDVQMQCEYSLRRYMNKYKYMVKNGRKMNYILVLVWLFQYMRSQ